MHPGESRKERSPDKRVQSGDYEPALVAVRQKGIGKVTASLRPGSARIVSNFSNYRGSVGESDSMDAVLICGIEGMSRRI